MNKGFTLIELLIVIAVIGILSGIVLINIGDPSESATIAVTKANARQVETIIALKRIENATPDEIAAEINKIDVPLAAKVIGAQNYILEKFPNGSRITGHNCGGGLNGSMFITFLRNLDDDLQLVVGGGNETGVILNNLEKEVFCSRNTQNSTTFALLVSINGDQNLYYCITSGSRDRIGFYNRNTTNNGNRLKAGCIENGSTDDFLNPTPISQ